MKTILKVVRTSSRIVVFALGLLLSQHTLFATVDVQPLNVTSSPSSVAVGASLSVSWQIRNNGTTMAASSYSQVRITASSTSYGNLANNVGSGVATGTIAAGATINQSTTVTVPSLTAGTYYVWVIADNTSLLNQTDVNNDEAVSASFTVNTATQLPDLVISSITANPTSGKPGDTISVTVTVKNNGPGSAPSSTTRVRLAAGTTITTSDPLLDTFTAAALTSGQSQSYTVSVTIPSGQSAGSYYMGATANADAAITEGNGNNNQNTTPFTVNAATQLPDLVISSITASPTSGKPGDTISVTVTVKNNGPGSAPSSTTRVRLAAGTTITTSDPLLDTFTAAALTSGQSQSYTVSVTIPSGQSAGSYYMGATANADAAITEGNGNNNQNTTPFTVNAATQLPDLVISSITASPTSGKPGDTISVTVTVKNNGPGSAPSSTTRVRLAAGTTITTSDPLLDTFTAAALTSGQSQAYTVSVTIPSGQSAGSYYMGATANADAAITEGNGNNNQNTTPFTVNAATQLPDLVISSITASPTSGKPGDTISVTVTVKNNGPGSAPSSTTRVRLAAGTTITTSDPLLDTFTAAALTSGQSQSYTVSVTIPSGQSAGSYYMGATANADAAITEGNGNNNQNTTPFTVNAATQLPDLVISSITASPSSGKPGDTISVTVTVKNNGPGSAPSSTTRVRLAAGTTITTSDPLLDTFTAAALTSGQSQSYTVSVTIPSGQSAGSYYMGATANADAAINEGNGNNNQNTTPFTVNAATQLPDLVISSITASPTSGKPGDTISVTVTVKNNGPGSAPSSTTRVRLAAGTTITTSDPLLDTFTAAALTSGQSQAYTVTVTIPSGQSAGSYHMGATANADAAITEGNGNNNQNTTPFTVNAATQLPDLVISSITANPTSGKPGDTISVTVTVKNNGPGSAPSSTTRVRLAAGTTITTSDPLLDTFTAAALTSGQSQAYTVTVTIPSGQSAGSYHMGATANADAAITEGNGNNNQNTTPFTVNAATQLPDLVISSITANPTSGKPGDTISVTVTVKNNGPGSAPSSTTRVRLAAGTTITTSDPLLDTFTAAALTSGQSQAYTVTVTIPSGQSAGSYHMGATANADAAITEGNGNNNQNTTPFTVNAATQLPDLVISSITANPTSGKPGDTISVTVTVKNNGPGNAPSSTTRVRLAAATTITANDPLLNTFTTSALTSGQSQSSTVSVTIPSGQSAGNYYMGATANADAALTENNGFNNQNTTLFTVNSTTPSISAARSTLAVSPTSVPADGTTVIRATATLRDANNNPVAGKAVHFNSSSTVTAILEPTSPTDANGQATATITANVPMTTSIWAVDTTDAVTIQQQPNITFTSARVTPGTALSDAIAQLYSEAGYDLATYNANLAINEGANGDYFQKKIGDDRAEAAATVFSGALGAVLPFFPDSEDAIKITAKQLAITAGKSFSENVAESYILPNCLSYMTSSGSALSYFGQTIASMNTTQQQMLLQDEQNLLSGIPATAANNSAAYIADLSLRMQANRNVIRNITLVSQQSFLAALQQKSANGQLDLLGPLFLSVNVVGDVAGTIIGTPVAGIAVNEVLNADELLITSPQDQQNLNGDQESYNTAISALIANSYYSDLIYANTLSAFNAIAQGQPPNPITGSILSVNSQMTVQALPATVGGTLLTWFSQLTEGATPVNITGESSVVSINNSSSKGASFSVIASYSHTISVHNDTAGISDYTMTLPIVVSTIAHLDAHQTAQVQVYYGDGSHGALPDVGTPIAINVLGYDDNQGIYYVASATTTIQWPTTVGSSSASIGKVVNESSSVSAFTFENPLKTYVFQNPSNQTYQADILIANPFIIPLLATVTQPLPSGITVLNTDGRLGSSAIVWTNTVATNGLVEHKFAFTLSSTPGVQTNLPAPTLTFSDPNANSLALQSVAPTFQGLFPIQVSGSIPTGVAGVDTPMKVAVTNLTEAIQTGSFMISLTNSSGDKVGDTSQLFSVNGLRGKVLSFTLPGNLSAGTYLIAGSLEMNGGLEQVFSGMYSVVQNPVRPTLSIGSPVANQKYASTQFTVSGTAKSSRGIAAAWYQLNSDGWALAAGTSNWTAGVTLTPGTNTVGAYAVDANGNVSLTNSVKFLYIAPSMMTVLTNGNGKVTPNLNGQSLNVGEGYTLAAVAGNGQVFSNWTGSISSTANPLTFLMQSNMVLRANFISSPFVGPHGIYNGLFYTASGVTEETAGMVRGLNLGPLGTYSATILVGGKTYGISGGFNLYGQTSANIPRVASLGGPLAVEMVLNLGDLPSQITGTISGTNGGPWVANLIANRATNNGSAEYTMLLSPMASAPGLPPKYAYMLMTNHAGMFTITGALADGTSLTTASQTVPVDETANIPIYDSLYSNTGLLLGWVNIEGGWPVGNLEWIKKASRSTAYYTNGFTNLLSAQGSLWTNPAAHTAAIDLPAGQLSISGGTLLLPLIFDVAVSNNNALLKLPGSPTNSLTGSVNPKTGLFTITFGNGAGKATTAGTGAVLQNATNAGGFFLGTTNAGGFFLGKTNAGSVNLDVPMLIASNLNSPQGLVLNGNYVYFADSSSTDGVIKSVPNSGGTVATLVTGLSTSDGHTPDFVIVNSTIYGGYGGYNAYNMFSAPSSGGASTTIGSTTGGYFFGVANSIVYYGSGFYYINSVTTSGANATQLASGVWVRGSAVDGIGIYFSDYDTKNVYKYSFALGTITPLITGNSSSDGGLFIDANNVYFNNAGNVLEVSKGGGAVTTLVSSGAAGGYASDGSNVFYVETNAIKSVPVISGAPSTVVNLGMGGVSSMGVDGSYLYWCDTSGGAGAGKIWRMAKP